MPPRRRKSIRRRKHTELGGRCFYCGNNIPRTAATLDHLTPTSRGGSDRVANLTVACRPCNALKANRTLGEFKLAANAVFWGETLSQVKAATPYAGLYCDSLVGGDVLTSLARG